MSDSLFPDGYYRATPSVWFVAGAVAQSVMLAVLYGLMIVWFQADGIFTTLAAAVWTAYLIYRIWPHKMAHAGLGWRVAFLAMLAGQLAFFAWGVTTAPACEDIYEYPEVKCKMDKLPEAQAKPAERLP